MLHEDTGGQVIRFHSCCRLEQHIEGVGICTDERTDLLYHTEARRAKLDVLLA